MSSPISIYLKEETLRKLDALVEEQASKDKAAGLKGRAVASRSSMIDRLINEKLLQSEVLNRETISYWVIELAKAYGAEKVSLFGSYARNEATTASDVDLLLEKGNIKGVKVLEFQDELSEKLGCKVDIVTTAGASERFLNRIAPECISLYNSQQESA